MADEIMTLSRSKVSTGDVTASARELAILIEAGLPLLRAIRIMANRTSNKTLAAALEDVATRVERGSSLAAALAAHSSIFDDLFVNIIKMGEAGGSLDSALQRLANHYEREEDLRRRVRNALIYPISALLIALVVVCIIVIGVVPRFTAFYEQENIQLPFLTRCVQTVGNILVYGWYIVIPLALLLWYGFRRYSRTPTGRRQVDAWKLKIPRINRIYIKVLTTRLSMTMTTLIQNGIPLVPALRLAGDTVNNVIVSEVCRNAANQVESGESLTSSLEKANLFPPLFMDMVGVGEEAGSLDTALERVAAVYEQDTRLALETMVTLIQPVLVIVIGLAVLVLAVAVLKPYFELQNVILG